MKFAMCRTGTEAAARARLQKPMLQHFGRIHAAKSGFRRGTAAGLS
jgi:hypothetical protein